MTIRFSTTTKCNPNEWVQWTKPISPLANAFICFESFNQFKMFSNNSNNNNSHSFYSPGPRYAELFLEEQMGIKQGHHFHKSLNPLATFWTERPIGKKLSIVAFKTGVNYFIGRLKTVNTSYWLAKETWLSIPKSTQSKQILREEEHPDDTICCYCKYDCTALNSKIELYEIHTTNWIDGSFLFSRLTVE